MDGNDYNMQQQQQLLDVHGNGMGVGYFNSMSLIPQQQQQNNLQPCGVYHHQQQYSVNNSLPPPIINNPRALMSAAHTTK